MSARHAHDATAEGQRKLTQLLRACVPIIGTSCIPIDGGLLPLVVGDATRRPDLLDLPRIHKTEGAGDCRATWTAVLGGRSPLVFLHLELKRPARCDFQLVFDVAKCYDWLGRVAMGGVLVTGFTRGPHALERFDTVAWDVDRGNDVLMTVLLAQVLTRGVAKMSER